MLPILAEDVGKIEGSRVVSAGIVVQNYFDEKVNTNIKTRVTHYCSIEYPYQQSTNSSCI